MRLDSTSGLLSYQKFPVNMQTPMPQSTWILHSWYWVSLLVLGMPGAKIHISVHSWNGFFQVGCIGVTASEFKVR